jgi:hypothetical protein
MAYGGNTLEIIVLDYVMLNQRLKMGDSPMTLDIGFDSPMG